MSESQSFKVRPGRPKYGVFQGSILAITQLQAGMGEEKPVPVTTSTSQTLKSVPRLFDMLPSKTARAKMLGTDVASRLEAWVLQWQITLESDFEDTILEEVKWILMFFDVFCMFEVKRCIWVSHICKNGGFDLKTNRDHRRLWGLGHPSLGQKILH